jgi:hypothetical protein
VSTTLFLLFLFLDVVVLINLKLPKVQGIFNEDMTLLYLDLVKRKQMVALVFLLAVAVFSSGFANAQDPVTYFDGTDHDAYLKWLQVSSYERSTFLPSPEGPLTGAALHWNITNDSVHLAVAARATGWVGFGIAESGS